MISAIDMKAVSQRYRDDGFAVIRQFVSGPGLDELQAQVKRLVDEVVPYLPREHVFYEEVTDPRTLKQIQHVGDHDAWFGDQFRNGAFRELADTLLGGSVKPKNMQYFNKPPVIGRATPPHQDGYYFMLEPCEALTMWLALDRVDAENGCIRYVRGSHQLGMREHRRTETLGFSQGIADYPSASDELNEVIVTAEPGDLLVHDALAIHRADGNASSTRDRRAIGLIYYSHRAREDTAAHERYQRRLQDDLKAAGKI